MHNRQALIVDDNLEFLRLLSSLLEQDQLLIYKAAGVQEAIELLENTTVDAICSDYGMRDGTGLELFQKLRLRDVKIPFMIMSDSLILAILTGCMRTHVVSFVLPQRKR